MNKNSNLINNDFQLNYYILLFTQVKENIQLQRGVEMKIAIPLYWNFTGIKWNLRIFQLEHFSIYCVPIKIEFEIFLSRISASLCSHFTFWQKVILLYSSSSICLQTGYNSVILAFCYSFIVMYSFPILLEYS